MEVQSHADGYLDPLSPEEPKDGEVNGSVTAKPARRVPAGTVITHRSGHDYVDPFEPDDPFMDEKERLGVPSTTTKEVLGPDGKWHTVEKVKHKKRNQSGRNKEFRDPGALGLPGRRRATTNPTTPTPPSPVYQDS